MRISDWSSDVCSSDLIGVLVATTVIEVGVDVPAASLMIVEHAENFGLAQLHQLRGRVGRGTAKSVCLLLRSQSLSETARDRLALMRETNDGFVIAEKDLELRGGGELLGLKQSGDADTRLATPEQLVWLLPVAHDDARLFRSEEHTSELQSLMRISYAVFCLNKKKTNIQP